ncbi:hypothetical protein [Streptomyces sp. NPDC046197]|uniref:hypothetical protein n=1 Tax=Streptomyces sp. NPDC046197 TaxID=3154337 RepID=UPI0033DBA76F
MPDRSSRISVLLVAALACVVVAGAVSGCSGKGNKGASTGLTPSAPNTASFSGTIPSAPASSASSAIASARASASAAASSAAARASEFEASVSADTARAAATAEKELKNVQGRGNAISEVAMTGLPKAQTGGVTAVLVAITNKSGHTASYAVQIDFEDTGGHVVETRYVGAQNLKPGQRAEPIAFSRKSAGQQVTPRLAKAQRY